MEKKDVSKIKENNTKLYSIYKLIGLDWIFYYAMKILFLTEVKEISVSNIILSVSFYSLFFIIFSMFNKGIINKIGKKESIVLGQFLNLISMSLILVCPNFVWLLVAELIHAMGNSFKGISETSLMKVSLPETNENGETFARVESKGYSKFCYIGALATLVSGFLYVVNPYIPIICCMVVNLIALFISLRFVDIEQLQKGEVESVKSKESANIGTIKQLKDEFKFVFGSKRLHTLMILLGILWGIISIFAVYQEILLVQLNILPYYIGAILAGFQLFVGLSSNSANKFNEKFSNHSLTYIGLIFTTGSILLGVATRLNIEFKVLLMVIVFAFFARAYSKGVFEVLKNRYMNNFADNKVLPKIYSVNAIVSNFCVMIIGIIATIILEMTELSDALLILGAIMTFVVLMLALYSKSRLGLKPEEYSKKDVEYKQK